ncbi:hypothetical protein [Paenibacillus sp. AN1007]|uniref:Uncharacterized protein n=1 Tax=Paenibacillus sp. AN1007 TaxID=3151385 RepID=A0AAU8NCH1_9BACL
MLNRNPDPDVRHLDRDFCAAPIYGSYIATMFIVKGAVGQLANAAHFGFSLLIQLST